MLILKPYIFAKYPEIISGVSTKIGAGRNTPYFFNMSVSVTDDITIVAENRKLFLENLGLTTDKTVFQKQVHGDEISFVNKAGLIGESDAMITNCPGICLAVSIADCVPILIYEPVKKIIAGVHSGWRGTAKRILYKTILKLIDMGGKPENVTAYIGPSISKNIYEVGKEVAELFDKKYVVDKKNKLFLDVAGINLDILLNSGIKKNNIQVSQLCTFALNDILYSYRREGDKSGRSFAVIAMKESF
jgi:polyphenol oxidase